MLSDWSKERDLIGVDESEKILKKFVS